MSERHPWRDNWVARLYSRVRELGHDSVTDFAGARPTASLVELAHELGKGDFAGVQVFQALVEEAERSRKVTRLVRAQFVRELWEALPDGWPAVMDDANRFKVARTLGMWSGFTPETHYERIERVKDALRDSPPPPGWRPLGPDDELLLTLLPDEEA